MEEVLVRLVTHRTPSGTRPGAVLNTTHGERLVDLGDVADGVLALITDDERMRAARVRCASAVVEDLPALVPGDLEAPIVPGKMLCLGYNYRGHTPDGVDPTADDPEYPDVFVKTPNTFAGPNDAVVIPEGARDVDYEGELAVVIRTRARNVSIEDAMSHVAGLTILNDVSDRAWQRRQSQWALGKCSDGFAPIGPWIVTTDDAPDPQDVLVEVVRDGEVTVSQSTSTTIFSVAFVISHISQVLTLEPGDIISTGTPQKLAEAQAGHRPLAPGDAVTVRISGIGDLTTTFIAAPSESPAAQSLPGGTA